MLRLAGIMAVLFAPHAYAADFEFCWKGSNGYRMEGTMTVPDTAMILGNITEDSVTAFTIRGFHNDIPIGTWDLSQLTPTTSWNLSFDPRRMVFPTGGNHMGAKGQAWNAGGLANDCGDPGFGFNSGTNAQDLCVNNVWITDSMIERATRFPVYLAGRGTQSCGGYGVFSEGDGPAHDATRLGKFAE